MTGAWGTYGDGQRWRRAARRAWLVLRTERGEVVQFDGPVLELLTESRTRFDRRLAELGPDILAPQLDEARFLRRLREDDPTRAIGDALLDQKIVAGMGTVWRSEACWRAEVDPWRTTASVSDDEALALCRLVRPLMQRSATDGFQNRDQQVYNRRGKPCHRCGAPIRSGTQGDDNRMLYWCPSCQT
jgi:endonuclease-8